MNRVLTSVFCLISVFYLTISRAQNFHVEGHVINDRTGEPIPFSRIFSLQAKLGTLSNESGFFSLDLPSPEDTLRIYLFGYETRLIALNAGQNTYDIALEISYQELETVDISAERDDLLYKLLLKCARKKQGSTYTSRAYYELKSYAEDRQIELVECFYNSVIRNNDLERLSLKAGRFGVQPYENHFFLSSENSKAITRMNLAEHNDFFPLSPLEMNLRKMKDRFTLNRISDYLDENNDSIYVIRFQPRQDSSRMFSGKIWIDPQNHTIYRIDYDCQNTTQHPFLPLFPNDTIKRLDLHISKTFEKVNGEMRFRQVNFEYVIHYADRNRAEYTLNTRALLYFYDYQHPFLLPHFRLHEGLYADYRNIIAMPYNAFFWENNREMMLNEEHSENTAFFNDPLTLGKRFFETNKYPQRTENFEHPYIHWSSEKRIRFREAVQDTLTDIARPVTQSAARRYDLSVQLYADRTGAGDSIIICTETVFDPFESYYYLPVDPKAVCFMNIYFDLCEILRREMQAEFDASDRQVASFERICQTYDQKLIDLRERYFKECDRGTNQRKTEMWNGVVRDSLGIDNIELFQPYISENESTTPEIQRP